MILAGLTGRLVEGFFRRHPDCSQTMRRPLRGTHSVPPTGIVQECRGAARAQQRRINKALKKAAQVTSNHGRQMAARDLELATGEVSATERAFRRLGFGWRKRA